MVGNETNNHFVFSNSDDRYSDDIFCNKSGNINRRSSGGCEDCNGYFATTIYGNYGCYDKEKKLFSRMNYAIPSYGSTTIGYMQGQLSEGIITDDYFETAQQAKFNDDNETVQLYNKFGIVKNGEIVVDFDYDSALTYKDGVTAMKKDNIWEYFNENGDMLFSTDCVSGVTEYYFDMARNSRKNVILPYLSSYNYIAVNDSQGGGYYDINGNSVISVGEFEAVRPVHNGLEWVKYDGKWGVIDIANNSTPVSATTTTTTETTTTTTVSGAINTTTAIGSNATTDTVSITENNVSSTITKGNNNNSNDNNNNNSGNNNSSYNNSSSGKSSPKTGVAGVGMAVTGIFVAIGTAFVFRKKDN